MSAPTAMSELEFANEIASRLIAGGTLSDDEVYQCAAQLSTATLMALSHKITSEVASQQVSLCSITNVKSGRCPQDCKWCAQSLHYKTGAAIYGVKDKEQCLAEAKECYEQGVEMFSLVASGRLPNDQEFAELLEIVDYLKANVPIKLCASLGLLTEEMLVKLKAHGIERYHCNLETAPSYFSKLVTRHSAQDKIKTLHAAQAAGLELCSGGIVGMGENEHERIELALALRQFNIKSIPINVLHPIAGTPLDKQQPLSDDELTRTICLFRLANPDAYLRFAGGRALLSQDMVAKAIYCGINAAIVGDMLTTIGSNIAADKALFIEHHYKLPQIRCHSTTSRPQEATQTPVGAAPTPLSAAVSTVNASSANLPVDTSTAAVSSTANQRSEESHVSA